MYIYILYVVHHDVTMLHVGIYLDKRCNFNLFFIPLNFQLILDSVCVMLGQRRCYILLK